MNILDRIQNPPQPDSNYFADEVSSIGSSILQNPNMNPAAAASLYEGDLDQALANQSGTTYGSKGRNNIFGKLMSVRDAVWIIGIFIALGATWGMTSQRINAMERDIDRIEEALILFTKMEARIAVIENEVKNINKKLDK
jgi:hypothetical protein